MVYCDSDKLNEKLDHLELTNNEIVFLKGLRTTYKVFLLDVLRNSDCPVFLASSIFDTLIFNYSIKDAETFLLF